MLSKRKVDKEKVQLFKTLLEMEVNELTDSEANIMHALSKDEHIKYILKLSRPNISKSFKSIFSKDE